MTDSNEIARLNWYSRQSKEELSFPMERCCVASNAWGIWKTVKDTYYSKELAICLGPSTICTCLMLPFWTTKMFQVVIFLRSFCFALQLPAPFFFIYPPLVQILICLSATAVSENPWCIKSVRWRSFPPYQFCSTVDFITSNMINWSGKFSKCFLWGIFFLRPLFYQPMFGLHFASEIECVVDPCH